MSEPPERFEVPGPAFYAKYPSQCANCGEGIERGDAIRYIAKRTVAHARCCEGSLPSGPPGIDPILGAEESWP
jgi:hypothetical protein